MRIIGIDEAGRGPVIGPFVMCGVQIQQKDEEKLRAMGVRDSKQLTRKRREFLFDMVKTVVEKFHLVLFSPSELDAMMLRGINLNAIEEKATLEILSALDGDIAYIDCPSPNIEQYAAFLRAKLAKKIQLCAEHKADETYVCVGAASILAKVTRDREIEKLQRQYGDIGSGYPSDSKTQAFLVKYGEKYPELVRHCWEPWERVIKEKTQKRLGDF